MDIKKFTLSYYTNALNNFHIQRLSESIEAEKLHTHEYFQAYYILKGYLTHYISDSAVELSGGDAFIIPPDLCHRVSVKQNTVFYSFSFNRGFLKSTLDGLAESLLNHLQSSDIVRPKITVPASGKMYTETLIGRIMEEFTRKAPGSVEVIRSSVNILLTDFSRIYFEKALHTSASFETNLQSASYCLNYIKKHFTEDISLGEMAQLSMMSRSHFCSLFSEMAGMPFKEYLNKLRIEKALELICDNKLSTVSFLCGFSDFSTFYRNFVKFTGVSPSKYREIRLRSLDKNITSSNRNEHALKNIPPKL